MGDKNLSILTDALANTNFIQNLDVSSNKITNEGAYKIAHLMSQTN